MIIGIEIEWQQLMTVVPIFNNWIPRGLLYILLAATTYDNDKTFYLYDFTTYVCLAMFIVASMYFVGTITTEIPKYFKAYNETI
jgi:hypothetical protein